MKIGYVENRHTLFFFYDAVGFISLRFCIVIGLRLKGKRLRLLKVCRSSPQFVRHFLFCESACRSHRKERWLFLHLLSVGFLRSW